MTYLNVETKRIYGGCVKNNLKKEVIGTEIKITYAGQLERTLKQNSF